MITPIGQRLLLGNLIDLPDQSCGSIGIILVFQHLTNRHFRLIGKRPGFYISGILPGACI